MVDTQSPPFVMQGARHAIAMGFEQLEEQVTAIERSLHENPGLCLDLSRSIVEGACRKILTERDVPYDLDAPLSKLYQLATQNIPMLPAESSGAVEVRRSLQRTIGGLHTSIQGISELRNQSGFASHGSAETRPQVEWIQAWVAAEAADTIVSFLCRLHLQDRTPPPPAGPRYDDDPSYNEWLDDAHDPIRILDSEFLPSEVLFQLEPQTYRVHLAGYRGGTEPPEPDYSGRDP